MILLCLQLGRPRVMLSDAGIVRESFEPGRGSIRMANSEKTFTPAARLYGMVLATVLVAIATLAAPAPSSAEASKPVSISAKEKRVIGGLFNKRYCEIFGIAGATEEGFPVTIYNTIGLNNCPTAVWDSLSFSEIAAGQGWLGAAPNGPRRWLVDAVAGGEPGPAVDLGGLMMRPVASLTTTSLTPDPFTITKIGRDNNWIFRKGRKVRDLLAPNGRRFVMQAYTNTIDPGLNLKTLNQTGSNPAAAIPDGWKFKTRKLRRKLVVKAGGEATIVRDGLGSVYQKYKLPKKKKRR